jgi:hypothetical protein
MRFGALNSCHSHVGRKNCNAWLAPQSIKNKFFYDVRQLVDHWTMCMEKQQDCRKAIICKSSEQINYKEQE